MGRIVSSLLLLFSLASQFAVLVGGAQQLQPWQQCGGKSNCPASNSCADRAWEAVSDGAKRLIAYDLVFQP